MLSLPMMVLRWKTTANVIKLKSVKKTRNRAFVKTGNAPGNIELIDNQPYFSLHARPRSSRYSACDTQTSSVQTPL